MMLGIGSFRAKAFAACMLAFAAVSTQVVAALPISSPRPVNSYAGSDTSQDVAASVATDGQGHWIAVWHSNDTLGGTLAGGRNILYSSSVDDGATWSAAAALNSDATTVTIGDYEPVIASDGHGRWVAMWQQDPGGNHLRYAVSDNNGATWSTAADLTPFHGDDDEYVQLATDGNGNWIAVWSSTNSIGGLTGGDDDIHYAVSTDNGTTWSAPAALNTTATTDNATDRAPVITTDGQGHWIVAWQFRDSGPLGSDYDVVYSVSSNNGATWSANQPLNSYAAMDTSFDYSVQLANDQSGHWMAVWQSQYDLGGTVGTDDDIFYAVSSDNGATWSDAAALNSNADTDISGDTVSNLVVDRDGHCVVVWTSGETLGGTIGNDSDLLYAVSSDFGATWTEVAAFNTNAATDSGHDEIPAIATDQRGHWVACWTSSDSLGGTIGTDQDILAATLIFPDCNDNGVSDSDDIDGASDDCDGNGVPDECQSDGDGDGVIDDCDECPGDPLKTSTGFCGCGNPETDTDGDGTPDCVDGCPNEPAKSAPGFCGCGNPETDTDNDGMPDCVDDCPNDPEKTAPGTCGCGTPDTDSDGDGTPDCNDDCPNDAAKTEAGACGCGTADADTDGDGVLDCNDNCPEVANDDQADGDGDGVGDACVEGPPAGLDSCGAGVCGSGMATMLPMMICSPWIMVRLVRRRRK